MLTQACVNGLSDVLWLEEHGEQRGRILPPAIRPSEEQPEERGGRVSRSSGHSRLLEAEATPTTFDIGVLSRTFAITASYARTAATAPFFKYSAPGEKREESLVSPEGIELYSARSAVVGSTRAARQAGTLAAAMATIAMRKATAITVVESVGATP